MHEIAYLWIEYFWSSLKGNGPEALVQTAAYGVIAAVLIPAVRHFLHREFDKVKAHVSGENALIHAKMDHCERSDDDLESGNLQPGGSKREPGEKESKRDEYRKQV